MDQVHLIQDSDEVGSQSAQPPTEAEDGPDLESVGEEQIAVAEAQLAAGPADVGMDAGTIS